MSTVKAFDDLPENLTYPFVTPVLFLEAKQAIDNGSMIQKSFQSMKEGH